MRVLTPSYAYLSSLTFVIVWPGYPRHPEMWLEDGNLVLVASHTTAFRVHRSVISQKSGVFADMFSFPQPTGSGNASEITTIHLPDSPKDMFYFLDAIYNGRK